MLRILSVLAVLALSFSCKTGDSGYKVSCEGVLGGFGEADDHSNPSNEKKSCFASKEVDSCPKTLTVGEGDRAFEIKLTEVKKCEERTKYQGECLGTKNDGKTWDAFMKYDDKDSKNKDLVEKICKDHFKGKFAEIKDK